MELDISRLWLVSTLRPSANAVVQICITTRYIVKAKLRSSGDIARTEATSMLAVIAYFNIMVEFWNFRLELCLRDRLSQKKKKKRTESRVE